MPRQFLPALRGLLVPRTAITPPAAETKDLLAGNSYVSMTYAGVTNVWGTPGRADGWDMERVVVEGYERSIWTFKSVEAISKHASTLPIQIGRGGDERRFAETLDEHPLLKLLNHTSNPLETGDVFKKRLSAQLLLSKKGCSSKRPRAGAAPSSGLISCLRTASRSSRTTETPSTSSTSSSPPTADKSGNWTRNASSGSATRTPPTPSAASPRSRPRACPSTWMSRPVPTTSASSTGTPGRAASSASTSKASTRERSIASRSAWPREPTTPANSPSWAPAPAA